MTLNNFVPGSKVTMELVTNALMNGEARRNEAGKDQSFTIMSENKERGERKTGGRGQGRGRGRHGQSRGRSHNQGISQEITRAR